MTGPAHMSSRDAVGLIGVGLMGTAFAHRLTQAGLPVVGFDVDRARLAGLAEMGGEGAASAGEGVRRCTHVIIVVFSADQAEEVIDEIASSRRRSPEPAIKCSAATGSA